MFLLFSANQNSCSNQNVSGNELVLKVHACIEVCIFSVCYQLHYNINIYLQHTIN